MTTAPRGARRAAALALASAAALALGACGGSSGARVPAAPAPSGSQPGVTNGHPTSIRTNPLTGQGGGTGHPVVAVKIDDTAPGRPQVGIDQADVVYVEAAEAGLTRLAAVFSTHLPRQVGYVRSTRPSDPELLSQYGRVTEVFSGGQAVSRNIARRAGFNLWNLGAGDAYFHRVTRSASDYINVVADLSEIGRHTHTTKPRSIGWHFAGGIGRLASSRGTDPRTTVTGVYGVAGGTPVEFGWDAKAHHYVRYIDGSAQHAADGKAVSADNVVVQSCDVHSFTADRDVNGNPAQFTTTVGSGPVSVFRDGRRIDGTWSRAKASSGTSLRTRSGRTIPLQRGNTWVVLVRKGVPVSG